MTEGNTDAPENVVGEDDPRKQLWVRAGVAGGLIAALLGGLAVFDYVSRPPVPTEVPLPTRPIAPAQVMPDAGRDAPPDVLRAGSEASHAPDAVSPEESAPPLLPGGVASDAEAPPQAMRSGRIGEASRGAPPHAGAVVHAPVSAARSSTPASPPAASAPTTTVGGSMQPAVVAHQPALQEAPRPASVAPSPAVSAAPVVPPVPAPRQPLPAGNAGVAAAPAAASTAPPSRPYVLEFGVFTTVASAEALRARLAQAGIPSQLEARVVVGPFADRKEALAAQSRLREKGIDSGTLLPLGR